MDGLGDAPRSGRPRTIDDDEVQGVLAMTLETPPDGSTHWSVRRLAAATGVSPTTVHRIWRDHQLKPHQLRSFKFSKDPQLTEKIVDVVGLYMAPPKGALVLCVDEKTQIQALDRTQATLPMKAGKAARMTHDYKRNGTISLYAALEIATEQGRTADQTPTRPDRRPRTPPASPPTPDPLTPPGGSVDSGSDLLPPGAQLAHHALDAASVDHLLTLGADFQPHEAVL